MDILVVILISAFYCLVVMPIVVILHMIPVCLALAAYDYYKIKYPLREFGLHCIFLGAGGMFLMANFVESLR